ncbi:hypothetical protein LVJ94_34625 [Pendulispora rubella]|uniref:Uncharacterized protein n=1 Tax=Pendulispora rubella TaxID=2741070 RepID=A0ABZ2KVC4_9BACT
MSKKDSMRGSLSVRVRVTGELPEFGSKEFVHRAERLVNIGRATVWRSAEWMLRKARRLAWIASARAEREWQTARLSGNAEAFPAVAAAQAATDVREVVRASLQEVQRRLRHVRGSRIEGYLFWRLAERNGRDPNPWIEYGYAEATRDLQSLIERFLYAGGVMLSEDGRACLRESCNTLELARRWLGRPLVAKSKKASVENDATSPPRRSSLLDN